PKSEMSEKRKYEFIRRSDSIGEWNPSLTYFIYPKLYYDPLRIIKQEARAFEFVYHHRKPFQSIAMGESE
ncbi:hypothetical protein, partial [Leptospira barantonii]|uniref:hypothetical protein n=1 Tax=Leptospira barantonii TaxID=2023184 RepID=UPI001AEF9912